MEMSVPEVWGEFRYAVSYNNLRKHCVLSLPRLKTATLVDGGTNYGTAKLV